MINDPGEFLDGRDVAQFLGGEVGNVTRTTCRRSCAFPAIYVGTYCVVGMLGTRLYVLKTWWRSRWRSVLMRSIVSAC